jgi:hypothetical protein
MSSASDVVNFDYIYLFACGDCERFYALHHEDNEPPPCPGGHEYAQLVTPAAYGDHTICVTPTCKHFMWMNKAFPKGTCEGGCKRAGVKLADIVDGSGVIDEGSVLRKHVIVTEAEGTKGASAGLARSLEAELENAEGFKSGHHPNRKGHHSAAATATHQHGDKSNATTRKKKAAKLKLALEKLRAADDFNEADYADVLTRSDAYVKKYG